MSSSFNTISHVDEFGDTIRIVQENCATTDYNRFIIITSSVHGGHTERLFCMSDELLNKLSDLINTQNCTPSTSQEIEMVKELYT